MAPHSSTLAWKIPWTEEPGRLQSMASQRVGYDWATSLSRLGDGNGNPLQCSRLENPRDGGAWWAAVCGVAQSWTRLKWLSSSKEIENYSHWFVPCFFQLTKYLRSFHISSQRASSLSQLPSIPLKNYSLFKESNHFWWTFRLFPIRWGYIQCWNDSTLCIHLAPK